MLKLKTEIKTCLGAGTCCCFGQHYQSQETMDGWKRKIRADKMEEKNAGNRPASYDEPL